MEVRMDGRVALITGGSEGMGLAMAKKFASSGAKVAIVARRQGPLDAAQAAIAAEGGVARAYSCDVSQAGPIADTVARVTADLGPVDILVNNAGESKRGPLLEITDEMWQHDLNLKLFAAIRLFRLVFPGMKERRWGRVVNVLNVGAKAPPANGAPTAVSRAAGMALTKVMAGEGAPHNVLVNALLTGYIESEQWTRRHAETAPDMPFDAFLADQAKKLNIPIGRFGKAEEFANMACFLASDAGSYITGCAINVDGNRSPVV